MLAFTNVVCACSASGDSGVDSNPYAQHQNHGGTTPGEPDCEHEGCPDCVAFVPGLSPNRDATGAGSKLELDHPDWVSTEPDFAFPERRSLAFATPRRPPALRSIQTPVSRQDLLLE
jgi:hypothetical protein